MTDDPDDVPARATTDLADPYARTRVNYWLATTASKAGSAMALLAGTFTVYGLSQSVLATAAVLVLFNLPMLMLGSVSSKLLDRFGAALVYSLCDLVLFVVTLGLAALSFAGHLSVPVLFVWQLLTGVMLGISGASYTVLPRTLAPEGKVPEYNAQLAQAGAVAALIGLFAGGLVVETIGTSWVFVLDALTFLGVPLAVVSMWGHTATPSPSRRLRHGIDAIRADAGLRSAVGVAAFAALLLSPIASLFPAMAARLGASAHFLSLQMAAFAVGGLSIASIVRRVHRRIRWSTVVRTSMVIGGLGMLAIAYLERTEATGLAAHVTIVLILLAVGLVAALIDSVIGSLVQLGAPDEHQTSVLTIYGMVLAILAVVASLAVGLLSEATAVWVSLVAIGIVLEGFALLGSRRRIFTDLDRIENIDESASPPQPLSRHFFAHRR